MSFWRRLLERYLPPRAAPVDPDENRRLNIRSQADIVRASRKLQKTVDRAMPSILRDFNALRRRLDGERDK